MTENQKLREALQAVIAAHDACIRELGEQMRAANLTNMRIEGQAVIEAFSAIEHARQALALLTAAQVDDINVAESFTSVTKTAAPVGEREAFENEMRHVDVWGHRSLKKRASGNYENWQVNLMWDAWQARAALRAGDAVGAQRYRFWRDEYARNAGEEVSDFLIAIANCWTPSEVDAVIDAAMRKGQL